MMNGNNSGHNEYNNISPLQPPFRCNTYPDYPSHIPHIIRSFVQPILATSTNLPHHRRYRIHHPDQSDKITNPSLFSKF